MGGEAGWGDSGAGGKGQSVGWQSLLFSLVRTLVSEFLGFFCYSVQPRAPRTA